MKRIGVYGGSFDPVHMGHLLLAEYCRVECKLDQVQFVPASVSPHKTEDAPASGKDRVEMLQLAIGGNSAFELNDLELQRGGVSYTVDTVTQIQQQHEDAELFLMMGADSLVDFPSWRDPAGICRVANLLVVGRPGSSTPDFSKLKPIFDQLDLDPTKRGKTEAVYVESPLVEISSSDLRRRIQQGKSIRYQLPRAVEKYIEHHRLYI